MTERLPARERKSINFRVHALASSLFKGAQQFYGSRFGLGVPEMRILSNLDSDGPLAASQLVALTAMDKALVSRILTVLHDRGYIAATPTSNPRRRCWMLARSGRRLVAQLQPLWRQREAIIQAGLSKAERDLLEALLGRLFRASEELRAAEAAALKLERARTAQRRSAPRPVSKPSARAAASPSPGE